MARALALALIVVAGCGRFGFGPSGSDDASGPGDAGPPPIDAAIGLGHEIYIKASNTGSPDAFGTSLALADDGATLVVGAPREASVATGVGGNQADNSVAKSGAVYVFVRGASWAQQAYIKASNTGANDFFGSAVAISGDGSTIAIGAPGESSAATGIGGLQSDNSALGAGAVYVFVKSGGTWLQQAYVKASNTSMADGFGTAVALSADGSTLAVGASAQADNGIVGAGAAYVFVRTVTWTQQAYVKAAAPAAGDHFGGAVALAADGSTLAVGAAGVAGGTGAVDVFTRAGVTWSPATRVGAANANAGDNFGISVAVSGDGATLAAGAHQEASSGADPLDNSLSNAGAAYVFTHGAAWVQQAYVKATNPDGGDNFGYALSLSRDGATLAVGAENEHSRATGIGGDQTDNSDAQAGATYVFTRSGATWAAYAYVKATNTDIDDEYGAALAISGDGTTLAVGAYGEASAATGIDGNAADNSSAFSGAAYIIEK